MLDKFNAWSKSCGHPVLADGQPCRCKLMQILIIVLIINIVLNITMHIKGKF
jgi:hypothetical protein